MTNKNKSGFTLAEVLITLAIIGVVAALTIPNLIQDIDQRKYNTASGDFQRKFGEALNIMNAQNNLRGFSSTKDFVKELGNNFKVLKVCDDVTECFVEKFKKSSGTEVETSTLTTSESLGRKEYGTETVGVQFANGVSAILAYNPDFTVQSNGNVVNFAKDSQSVKMNTNAVSIVFDVSGDTVNKIGDDIRTVNTNLGSGGVCEHTKVGEYCIEDIGTNYSALDCSSTTHTPDTIKYCGSSTITTNYWTGAQKACTEIDMMLPDLDTLTDIYNIGKTEGGTPRSGVYYSSYSDTNGISGINFSNGATYDKYSTYAAQYNVLCISN